MFTLIFFGLIFWIIKLTFQIFIVLIQLIFGLIGLIFDWSSEFE